MLCDGFQALVGAGGRGQKHGRELVGLHGAEVVGGFFDGEVGDQSAVNSCVFSSLAEFVQSELEDGIEITKDDEAGLRVLADLAGDVDNSCQISALREGALAGALDDGAVGDGIAEGNAQFDDVGARLDGRKCNIA